MIRVPPRDALASALLKWSSMSHAPRHASDLEPAIGNSGSGASPGKFPASGRLAGRSQTNIVFRVESADAARGLADAMGLRDGNGVAEGADAAVDRAAGSGGTPLPSSLRDRFEGSLGSDLSSVRVHTGTDSATAASAVGARAYTTGQDIHFGAGQYDPSSAFGVHLIAHEVAHTVQQQGGAPTRQHKLEVSGPQDAAETEADRAADAMVAGAAFSVASAGGVQRKAKAKGKDVPMPKRRLDVDAMIGETFEIPFREDVDLAFDEGVIQALYEIGDGDDRVQVFKAATAGVTTVSQLNSSGNETTTWRVTVVDHKFEALAGAQTLSSTSLNVIESAANSKVVVRFKTSSNANKARITASSQELQESGDARAFTVTSWRWDGDDVYWTIDCERPGTTVGRFRVFLDGKPMAEESYRIERRVNGDDSKHLFERARTLANDLGIHISGFAEEAGLNYSAAFAKVRDAIASDKEAEDFIRDSAVAVAGVVLSGVLGGVLKHATSNSTWMKGFTEGFLSEMTGNGSGAGTEIGVGIAGKYVADVEAEKVEPLDYFLKVRHGGTAVAQAIASLLKHMQDEMAKRSEAVVDPLAGLEGAIKKGGFPWISPTTDQFERQAWKTWLAAGNQLYSWGRKRHAVVARLDALSVAYVDHVCDYRYDVTGEERRKDAEEVQQRKGRADARDASDKKATETAKQRARAAYEKTGEFPEIEIE